MTITVLSGPSSVATDIVNSTCGQSNGAVTVGQVSGGISPYAYNFNNLGFGTVVSFTNLAAGSYPMSIRDGNGCIYSTFVIIGSSGLTCGSNPACEVTLPCNDNDPCTVNDVEVQLLTDGSICKPCAGVQIECDEDFITTRLCDDGDPSTINDMETVLDCDGSICVPCKGQPAPANVFIPNVFTPNGDGNNDYFTVYSGPNVKVIQELKIYDRWGSNLFSAVNIPANDDQAGWDGLYNGAKVGPGVYVYFAKIEFFDGQVKVRNGTITIAW
jgi:gliding motility-associated-like protein